MAKATKPVDQEKLQQKIADFVKKQTGLKIPRDGLLIQRAGPTVKVSVNSMAPAPVKKAAAKKPVAKKATVKKAAAAKKSLAKKTPVKKAAAAKKPAAKKVSAKKKSPTKKK